MKCPHISAVKAPGVHLPFHGQNDTIMSFLQLEIKTMIETETYVPTMYYTLLRNIREEIS